MKRKSPTVALTGSQRTNHSIRLFTYLMFLALVFVISAAVVPAHADDLVIGSEQSLGFTGQPVDFTIPLVDPPSLIRLIAHGADGGGAFAGGNDQCFADGGEGATVIAVFRVGFGSSELQPGGIIRFIVGERGQTSHVQGTIVDSAGGGGGGSGIMYLAPNVAPDDCDDWTILVAAGGGGGGRQQISIGVCTSGRDGGDAQTGECGGTGGGNEGGTGGCNGQPGENGGPVGVIIDPGPNGGGGGGGAYGTFIYGNTGKKGCPNGGIGGTGFAPIDGRGGWGFGGGGGGWNTGGGGGGGNSGGGGGRQNHQGAGGGSFVSNWAVTSIKNSGNGSREDGEALYFAAYGGEICTSVLDCNGNGVPDDCDLDGLGRRNDFESGVGGFQLNGNAVEDGGFIRLTTTATSQSGSVIFEPVTSESIDAFSVEFDFLMGGGTGADGMSFVLIDADQTGNDLLPGEGGANQPLVVSLDTYGSNAADGNHAILRSFGTQLASAFVPFTLDNNAWYHASIVFENGEVTVVLSNALLSSATVINSVPVPGFAPIRARYGLGARTGAATNTHRVDNVRFKVPHPNDCDANGVPDSCESDSDNDGLVDGCDNCPFGANADQSDADSDGVGNVCDVCPGSDDTLDADEDFIPDGCDNCPLDANSGQIDSDNDGVGNACDACPGSNDALDADGDGVPDGCDACPNRRPGDMNADTFANIDDVASFTVIVLDPASATSDEFCAADTNEDGAVNGLDVQAFMTLLVAP